MKILGIETSCDETAAAVVEDGYRIRSSVVRSQVELHAEFGGVVPELASRAHLELILPIIREALERAGCALGELGAIGVTQGPGLVGALLVGVETAKALSYCLGIPLVPVNHLEAHLFAVGFEKKCWSWPAIGLVVSGGHTDLFYLRSPEVYELIGRTRDDAVGEAFDKVAKMMGLGYPGGPIIERLARKATGDPVELPRPYLKGSYDFSFSGLKTAVLYRINELLAGEDTVPRRPGKREKHPRGKGKQTPVGATARDRVRGKGWEEEIARVAAGFQEAAIDVLVEKAFRAARERRGKAILVAGGVAANRALRERLISTGEKRQVPVYLAAPEHCPDNAAMIGGLAFIMLERGRQSGFDLSPDPNLLPGQDFTAASSGVSTR